MKPYPKYQDKRKPTWKEWFRLLTKPTYISQDLESGGKVTIHYKVLDGKIFILKNVINAKKA